MVGERLLEGGDPRAHRQPPQAQGLLDSRHLVVEEADVEERYELVAHDDEMFE